MWHECREGFTRTYTTATPDMLGEAAAELRTLRAELERRKYDTMHTCHAECQRDACVLRREVDALRAQLAEARENERAAVFKWRTVDLIYTHLITATDAREHMTRADAACGTLGDSDGDDGA
jgi:hypothetical protein